MRWQDFVLEHACFSSWASLQCKPYKSFGTKIAYSVKTMPEPVFEWYKDVKGKFRFRLKAANGEIIAVSESYNSKDGCVDGIESVKKNAPIAKVVEAKAK